MADLLLHSQVKLLGVGILEVLVEVVNAWTNGSRWRRDVCDLGQQRRNDRTVYRRGGGVAVVHLAVRRAGLIVGVQQVGVEDAPVIEAESATEDRLTRSKRIPGETD